MRKDKMKIFEALYNPSCCESAASTISIHMTKAGAYKAIRQSKIDAFNEWLDLHRWGKRRERKSRLEYGIKKLHTDEYKFDFDQWWGISETELLD